MPDTSPHTAVVAAQGHLIDSNILTTIFDVVIARGGAFEVVDFQIGRTNDEFSRLTLKVSAATPSTLQHLVEDLIPLGCHLVGEQDALVRTAERDRSVPDDFYSTTNLRTHVRVDGRWIEVERQRMDAVIVLEDGRAVCRKLRDIRTGDRVVCGLQGLRVSPEFRERDRADFGFMSNDISSERRVEATVGRIAALLHDTRRLERRIVFVVGPVVVHTGGAAYLSELIRARLGRRRAGGQCPRRPRRGTGAVRHVARRGSRIGRPRAGRPSPSHARHQRDQPRRRHSGRRPVRRDHPRA